MACCSACAEGKPCAGKSPATVGCAGGTCSTSGAIGQKPILNAVRQPKIQEAALKDLRLWVRNNLRAAIDESFQRQTTLQPGVTGTATGFILKAGTDANTQRMIADKARSLLTLHPTRASAQRLDDGRYAIYFTDAPEAFANTLPTMLADTGAALAQADAVSNRPTEPARFRLDPSDTEVSDMFQFDDLDDTGEGMVGSIFNKIDEAFRRKPAGIRKQIEHLRQRIAALQGRLKAMGEDDDSDPTSDGIVGTLMDLAVSGDFVGASQAVGAILADMDSMQDADDVPDMEASEAGALKRRRTPRQRLRRIRKMKRNRAAKRQSRQAQQGGGEGGGEGGGPSGGGGGSQQDQDQGDDGSEESIYEETTMFNTYFSPIDPDLIAEYDDQFDDGSEGGMQDGLFGLDDDAEGFAFDGDATLMGLDERTARGAAGYYGSHVDLTPTGSYIRARQFITADVRNNFSDAQFPGFGV